MRTALDTRTAALDAAQAALGDHVRQLVAAATAAALHADLSGAQSVISDVLDVKDTVDLLTQDIVDVVAGRHMAERDLRALLGSGRIVGSLHQIACLAGQIAKATRRAYPRAVVPAEVTGLVSDLGAVSDRMLEIAVAAVALRDTTAAQGLVEQDRQVDRLHQEMLVIGRSRAWPHPVYVAMELTSICRDYQRIAAHAVDVAVTVTAAGPTRPAVPHVR